MTAPTEAEIREALRLRTELYPSDNPRTELHDAVGGFGAFMEGIAYETLESPDPRDERVPESDELWHDLRPSEARDLHRLYQDARAKAERAAEAAIVEAFVAAALQFAELHPDAPRTKELQPA